MKLSKAEFIDKVHEKLSDEGLTKKQCAAAVDAVFASIADIVAEGDSVAIPRFGVFEVTERAERTARNPLTGESAVVPAANVVKFRASSALKDAVNK